MEYRERKSITPEEAVVLWQASRLSLSKTYEKAPEILKVHNSVIGTLGNFSASIGKAKSKKTFNVSAIVAAALTNGIVLQYAATLPENKRKILYVDTEQSPYHCQDELLPNYFFLCGLKIRYPIDNPILLGYHSDEPLNGSGYWGST